VEKFLARRREFFQAKIGTFPIHLSVDFPSRKMLNGTKGFYDFPIGV